MKKIGFCFFSHQAHIRHQLPVAAEMSIVSGYKIDLLYTTNNAESEIIKLLSCYPNHKCSLNMIKAGAVKAFTGRLKGRLYPNIKSVVHNNKSLLLSYDALVSPHTNLNDVMKLDRDRRVKYICTYHGAGDGQIGFDQEFSKFDLLLVPGEKTSARFELEGISHSNNEISVVGYAKFDTLNDDVTQFFNNQNPIIIYNPHYQQGMSSWDMFREVVFRFFEKNKQFNFIFAPHIKLFDGKFPDSLRRYEACENFLIDVGSERLMDATYIKAADIYIGDVSSQVYEFLFIKGRPVVHLNIDSKRHWECDPSYMMWHCGEVVDEVNDFSVVLQKILNAGNAPFESIQQSLMLNNFSKTNESAGLRGAKAIMEYMSKKLD